MITGSDSLFDCNLNVVTTAKYYGFPLWEVCEIMRRILAGFGCMLKSKMVYILVLGGKNRIYLRGGIERSAESWILTMLEVVTS